MTELRGFKFVATLVLVLKKIESEDKTKCDSFCSKSKAEIIINQSDINNVFKSIYTAVIRNIQKFLEKGSSLIIDSVIDHNISILRYNPLIGSIYTEVPKELNHPRKGSINVQNIDANECFKWCIARYLHPVDHRVKRITRFS